MSDRLQDLIARMLTLQPQQRLELSQVCCTPRYRTAAEFPSSAISSAEFILFAGTL